MEASRTGSDSDDSYGYDFTSDEEHQLVRLTTEASLRLSAQPASLPGSREDNVRTAIDSLPNCVAESVGHGDPGSAHRLCVARPAASRPDSGQARHGPPFVTATRGGAWFGCPLPRPCVPFSLQRPMATDGRAKRPVSRALSELADDAASAPPRPADAAEPEAAEDPRCPLHRFRFSPRKLLTVTDLTSGAWCELQYWYTLTRLPGGRRIRTPAMRQGSKVHKKLEDEVHTTVRVAVSTKEDGFALRLWNLIHGLRTLWETGLTRELEVWGSVDGNLVNGVIDRLNLGHPDPDLEEKLFRQKPDRAPQQSTFDAYFASNQRRRTEPQAPVVYLSDVKTRGSLKPASKAMLRPAMIQLQLYHRLIGDMASGEFDFLALLDRHVLAQDKPLSEAFVAQIAQLHHHMPCDAPSSPVAPERAGLGARADANNGEPGASSAAPVLAHGVTKYETLRQILALVSRELKLTFPNGRDSLGHMLRVEYVYQSDGRELDVHDFPVSRSALDAYLDKYMAWWRGERSAEGVTIEEAFKCRICPLAADCSWRQAMDEQSVQKTRLRKRATKGADG